MNFSDDVIERIRQNIFPAAMRANDDWKSFPWHTGPTGECDADKVHSSQALAVDVFGTLKVSQGKNAILDRIAWDFGLPSDGPWSIELEYLDSQNLLKERRLTQVDVMAANSKSLVFFECKFAETDGGHCSQPIQKFSNPNKGVIQCTGSYTKQVNPANQVEARCALTGKGIRYWEVIPQIFDYSNDRDYDPCPFRDSWYQWMRNLTNCYAIAKERNLKPAFVVVYADHPALPMAQKVRSKEWQDFAKHVITECITLKTISYQNFIDAGCEVDQSDGLLWQDLKAWAERKIRTVGGKRAGKM